MVEALERFYEEVIEREPNGSSPIRVASEYSAVGLSRLVVNPVLLLAMAKDKRFSRVDLGQRAQTMRRKKLPLIERVAKHPLQTLTGGDSEEVVAMPAAATVVHEGHASSEVGPILEEPLHALLEVGEAIDHFSLQDFRREQWNQPHHRADAQGHVLPIEEQLIVIKTVRLAPQAVPPQPVHRIRNGDEVFEEFRGHVVVGRFVARQLKRNGEHGRAKKSHPSSAIGLLQASSAGQRPRAIEYADIVQPEEPPGEQVFPSRVLAVHPPGEVEKKLLKDPSKKMA